MFFIKQYYTLCFISFANIFVRQYVMLEIKLRLLVRDANFSRKSTNNGFFFVLIFNVSSI